MDYSSELSSALAELNRITGISMDIHAGTPKDAAAALEQIQNLIIAYKEKYSPNYFLLNLMTAEAPVSNLHERAKRLHIQTECPRVLILLESGTMMDETSVSILKQIFPYPENVFFVSTDEHHLAIVFPQDYPGFPDIHLTALTIVDTLESEALIRIKLAYSETFDSLKTLSDAYKQARIALKVGQLFYSEQSIFPFDRLGVGRLIYQLPRDLCQDFMTEVFGKNAASLFDTETLAAAEKFFQNNLNISETSRQLYIHRNTLIYRLDQIQKKTGLDLRNFEDALTFKIALMIMNCLQSERTDS